MTGWQTDTTENITFATLLVGGNKEDCVWISTMWVTPNILFSGEINGISVRLSEQWQHNINDEIIIEQSGAVWWAYSKSDDYDKTLSCSHFYLDVKLIIKTESSKMPVRGLRERLHSLLLDFDTKLLLH